MHWASLCRCVWRMEKYVDMAPALGEVLIFLYYCIGCA